MLKFYHMKGGVLAALLMLSPAVAWAAQPQTLELSAKAQVEGVAVPLGVVVSTDNTDVILSPVDKDGATPVTLTLYINPKPKPVIATTSQAAAAIESSAAIQQNINNISPIVESYVKPAFTLIDGARNAAAGALDTQVASTRTRLAPNQPGEVLGAEAVKNSTTNPWGSFLYLLNTLYFYILTVLRFVVGSAGAFYPIVAIVFLYFIWRMFKRFRRPAY